MCVCVYVLVLVLVLVMLCLHCSCLSLFLWSYCSLLHVQPISSPLLSFAGFSEKYPIVSIEDPFDQDDWYGCFMKQAILSEA